MFSLTTSLDAGSGGLGRQTERRCKICDCVGGGSTVDLQRAASEEIGVQVAEPQIGVGHRRSRPATSITGRARFRAGAVGPDLEQADLIATRDAAAAGANLDQFDRR
jgi:hypothetical protein